MTLWYVQPWYPEGDDYPDEPGVARLVEADTADEARERFEQDNPGTHIDHYYVLSRSSTTARAGWRRARKRPVLWAQEESWQAREKET